MEQNSSRTRRETDEVLQRTIETLQLKEVLDQDQFCLVKKDLVKTFVFIDFRSDLDHFRT